MNNRPSQSQVAQNIQANIRQKPLEVQERIHRVARLLHGIIELTGADGLSAMALVGSAITAEIEAEKQSNRESK